MELIAEQTRGGVALLQSVFLLKNTVLGDSAMSGSIRETQDRISGCAIESPDLREQWLGFLQRHLMTYYLIRTCAWKTLLEGVVSRSVICTSYSGTMGVLRASM
jgi:hypothetical protein